MTSYHKEAGNSPQLQGTCDFSSAVEAVLPPHRFPLATMLSQTPSERVMLTVSQVECLAAAPSTHTSKTKQRSMAKFLTLPFVHTEMQTYFSIISNTVSFSTTHPLSGIIGVLGELSEGNLRFYRSGGQLFYRRNSSARS